MSYRPYKGSTANKDSSAPSGRIDYPQYTNGAIIRPRGKRHFWGRINGAYGVDNPEWYGPVRRSRPSASIQHLNRRDYSTLANISEYEYRRPRLERQFHVQNPINIKIQPEDVKISSESVGVQFDSELPKLQPERRARTQLDDKMPNKQSPYFNIFVDETCSERKLPAIKSIQPKIEQKCVQFKTESVLPQRVINLRDFLRKISPSFTSSVRNPLADAHQQFKFITGRK